MPQSAEALTAELYDQIVEDWPGEIDFYTSLGSEAGARGGETIEVACGTGRVARRLAQAGVRVFGLDASAEMLRVARSKAGRGPGPRWVQADMRSFDLGQTFALAIIPGHSFQFMLSVEDQLSCLGSIRRHLEPEGRLVVHLDHQDPKWLAEVAEGRPIRAEPSREVIHPSTGARFNVSRTWSFDRSTQTATVVTQWKQLDSRGGVIQMWTKGPVALHCVFRFEMEHLLARAGFALEALLGDFVGGALGNDSTEMLFQARRGAGPT